MIQTKLSTPTNSNDKLNHSQRSEVQIVPHEKQAVVLEEKPSRVSQYRPPSINLSTWSERPKTQISVKEDTDYKMKNGTSKVVVNADNKKTVEILNNNNNNVSIKVNGSEPIVSQGTGNVIIKIGANRTELKARPHSVAVDSSTDVSRVPIVRSVELKKPFRDSRMNNRSVTQICPDETSFYKSNITDLSYTNSFKNNRQGSDTVNGLKQSGSDSNFYVGAEARPVFRSITNAAPVVRGFSGFRKSWNVNGTLPSSKEVDSNKNNVHFTNVVLRNNNNYRNSVGAFPPPPQMPKSTKTVERNTIDPRDELLSAIRNFGGKKGLKSIKA